MKQKQLAFPIEIHKAVKLCSNHFSLGRKLSMEVSNTQLSIYSQYAKRKFNYILLYTTFCKTHNKKMKQNIKLCAQSITGSICA